MSSLDQVHLTNVAKLKGHSELNFVNSSFLLDYNSKLYGCTNALLFSKHFGITPGIDSKSDFEEVVEEWYLCPRKFKKSLFKSTPILYNEIKVKGYLNLSSATELVLLDLEEPGKGFAGVQISETPLSVEAGHPILLITCPSDNKAITQNIYPGKVYHIDQYGFIFIDLDDELRENSVFGSPVIDAESGFLLGVVSRFKEFDGKKARLMGLMGVDQLREDLKGLMGEQKAFENPDTTPSDAESITLSITISGDGFASPAELELRDRIEQAIEEGKVGIVQEAGSGMGKMQISLLLLKDIEEVKQILREHEVFDVTDILS